MTTEFLWNSSKLHDPCSVLLFIRSFTFLSNNTSIALIGRNPFRACFYKNEETTKLEIWHHLTQNMMMTNIFLKSKICSDCSVGFFKQCQYWKQTVCFVFKWGSPFELQWAPEWESRQTRELCQSPLLEFLTPTGCSIPNFYTPGLF